MGYISNLKNDDSQEITTFLYLWYLFQTDDTATILQQQLFHSFIFWFNNFWLREKKNQQYLATCDTVFLEEITSLFSLNMKTEDHLGSWPTGWELQ